MMLTENCTFPKGAIILVVEDDQKINRIFRDFILEEENFGHTFQVMNDLDLDRKRLAEEHSYYSAALLAARVRIEGVKVTPETILELHPDDGTYLMQRAADLEQRRDDFRSEIEAAEKGHPGAQKAGIQSTGDTGDEQGRGEGI